MKLLKINNKPIFYYVLFSCASVVSKNELELLLTLTKHNFNYLFIILRHPGTFSENQKKNYSRIVCSSNVTDCMCIYCHYRRLRTRSRLDMQRFHQIDEFMILRHPGTFKVVQYKIMLQRQIYSHQT